MAIVNKNQLVGVRGGMNPMYFPDRDCLRKFNYSNGAGWRTKNKNKCLRKWGNQDIRRKKR
jgi:hypothetical protein